MPLQGLYADQPDDQPPGGVLLANYAAPDQGQVTTAPVDRGALPGPGAAAPPAAVAPPPDGGRTGDMLMAQAMPQGPRGGSVTPTPSPGSGVDADLAEHLKDPDTLEMLGLKVPTGPSAPPPTGQSAHMLGNVPVIDAVPPKVTARYDPADVDRQIYSYSVLGMPIPANLTAAKTMFDSGIVIGSDNQPYRVKGNPKTDPDIIAQQSTATAAPELATRATDSYRAMITDPAEQARRDLYVANNLKAALADLPTSGPATTLFGRLSDIGSQFGIVTPDQLKAWGLPAPGAVTITEKDANTLLAQLGRRLFPGRTTDADLPVLQSMMARANNRKEANDALLNNLIMPSINRDIARSAALSSGTYNNPQQVAAAVEGWNSKHSVDEFVPKVPPAAAPSGGTPAAPSGGTPAARTWVKNPSTGVWEQQQGQ